MDLIRQHQNMMLKAQLPDSLQGLPVPDLSHWVVRVAEDQHAGLGIRKLLLQILLINAVHTINSLQFFITRLSI